MNTLAIENVGTSLADSVRDKLASAIAGTQMSKSVSLGETYPPDAPVIKASLPCSSSVEVIFVWLMRIMCKRQIKQQNAPLQCSSSYGIGYFKKDERLGRDMARFRPRTPATKVGNRERSVFRCSPLSTYEEGKLDPTD